MASYSAPAATAARAAGTPTCYTATCGAWSSPDVHPSYSAGFICLRCALESIDRPRYREDVTGCSGDDYPLLGGDEDGIEIEIRLPKRDFKRKTHAIHLAEWPDDLGDPVGEIISEYGWLLERLAMQASKVLVRQNYADGAVTIGSITLIDRPEPKAA